MASFNPKQAIINHFDELINQVDIDIETCLEKYNENQVVGEIKCFQDKRRDIFAYPDIFLAFFDSNYPVIKNEYQKDNDLCPETTKVVDYLNQVRMRTMISR